MTINTLKLLDVIKNIFTKNGSPVMGECECGNRQVIGNTMKGTPDGKNRICKECGKRISKISMSFHSKVKGRASLKGVGYTKSKNKWFAKFWEKHEIHKDSGRPQHVSRSLNKRTDKYDEKITFKDTGKIAREVHEPLSAHQGRGSAREKV